MRIAVSGLMGACSTTGDMFRGVCVGVLTARNLGFLFLADCCGGGTTLATFLGECTAGNLADLIAEISEADICTSLKKTHSIKRLPVNSASTFQRLYLPTPHV